MKKSISLFIFLLTIAIGFSLQIPNLRAQEPTEEPSSSDEAQKSELQQKIAEYEKKLTEVRAQKNTLAAQIDYMDTQMYIAQLRMDETEEKIVNAEKEINVLGVRIVSLDTSLDKLSKQLLERIIAGYKNRDVTLVDILLDSNNTSKLVNRLKYYDLARDRNQKSLLQVQEAKSNFVEQKDLREKKVEQLDELQTTLQQQKIVLDQQKEAKRILLSNTNNDEKKYQQLLTNARAELSGFSAFATAAGGGLTTFGNGSNGWYFTQRDPSWGTRILPGSSSSVLLAGCAVSSVAMVCKSYGQNITPAAIVSDSNKFIGGDLWNWAFGCDGKSTSRFYNPSQDQMKSFVTSGTPIILRLVAPSVSGLHFVVAYGWSDSTNDFKIHDPYYGPDQDFSTRYNWSQVTTAIVIQ